MTCSESVEPFSKSLFLPRALVAESKGQESCCFFIQRPWNNLNWTSWVWQGCKMKLGFLLLYPRYRQPIELNPDDPSGPADTLIFDPGLNNRLWPASQTWLAGFLVTKLLYCTSLHSTCTRKTDFPAHGYLLLFPVCNSFFFFAAVRRASQRFVLPHWGGPRETRRGETLRFISMRGKRTEKNNHKESLYVIFYVWVCILQFMRL